MPHAVSGLAGQVSLVLAALLLVAGCVRGQGAEAALKEKKLILFVQFRADEKRPYLPPSEIRATLKLGAEQSGCKTKDIIVRPLSPQAYEDLKNLTSDIESAPVSAGEGKMKIQQRRIKEAFIEWEINLGDPGLHLPKLDMEFPMPEKPLSLELTDAASEAANQVSVLLPTVQQGVYLLRLPPNKVPLKYVAHVEKLGDPERARPVSDNWPVKASYYYVAVLHGFEGDRDELIKAVKQREKVGINFTDVEVGQEFTFLFASIGSKLSTETGEFDKNEHVPYIRNLDEGGPRRAWMLFPLNKEECDAALKEYRMLNTEDLPRRIRDSQPLWAEQNPQLDLTPATKPRWIELPMSAKGDGFTRRLQLKDVKGLQEKWPEAWRLIVWEFDTGKSQIAMPVQHPSGDGQVYVLEQPVKQWPEGIKQAARSEKQP